MANASIKAAFERMWQHVLSALGKKSDISHNHDDVYYTEAEVDTLLSNKADTSHNHGDIYYTQVQVDTALAQKSAVQIITWEDDD